MQFTIFGKNYREGSYLLLIDLHETAEISFGRFLGGRALPLDTGTYIYIGSALGARGSKSFPLANRLLRHASRSGSKPPHKIRQELLSCFSGMEFRPGEKRGGKKLHWHIDYLLDLPEAEISHVIMVLSASRIEHHLAGLVSATAEASIVADRLGAQDASSGTHLFRITDPAILLEGLNTAIPKLLRERE
jgi:Uri superfamily endonuclease